MKQTLIISIVLFSFHLNAQVYFDHAFVEEDTLDDYTTEFVRGLAYNEFNNKYYVCGQIKYYDNNLNFNRNPVLYILNEYGVLENKIIYEQDTTNSFFDKIHIKEDIIIFSGRTDEVATEPGSDYLVAKVDFDGNLIAYNAFGSPIENEGFLSFTQSFEEGTINCGVQFTETIGYNSAQIWINKIVDDSIYWETIIDNPNLIDVAVDIERNPNDNTYLVYTEQEEIVAGDDVQHIVILKIDEQGNIVDQSQNLKTDPNTNNTEIRDMVVDDDGNIIIVGWLGSGSFICKLDQNFNIIWDKFFQKYEDESCLFKQCTIAADGYYIASGNVNTPEIPESITEKAGMIVKFDSETGDTIWYKEFVHYHADDNIVPRQHYVEALTLAPDSGFLVGGYVIYPSSSGLPQAAWVKKLDKNGCSEYNCGLPIADFNANISGTTVLFTDQSFGATNWYWDFGDQTTYQGLNPPVKIYDFDGTYNITLIVSNNAGTDTIIQTININTVSIENLTNQSINISPNPTNNFITITSTNQNLKTYRITDITGKIVQQNKFEQNINIQKLPKGVYFIGINGGGKSYKFVKI